MHFLPLLYKFQHCIRQPEASEVPPVQGQWFWNEYFNIESSQKKKELEGIHTTVTATLAAIASIFSEYSFTLALETL